VILTWVLMLQTGRDKTVTRDETRRGDGRAFLKEIALRTVQYVIVDPYIHP
jgi:hypothetical protein